MARDIDELLRQRRENEAQEMTPQETPEQAHDPQIVAQAMREGVPVAEKEAQVDSVMDPVFTANVDVMGEYQAALDQAKGMGAVGTSGPVTVDTIREATATMGKYQTGKAHL